MTFSYQFEKRPGMTIFSLGQSELSYLHLRPLQPTLHASSPGTIFLRPWVTCPYGDLASGNFCIDDKSAES